MNEKIVADIDPATGWSRIVVRQMAESIKLARRMDKRGWAILNAQPAVHVNVGKRTICEMNQTLVRLRVDIKKFPRLNRGFSNDFRIIEDWLDKNPHYADLRMIEFPIASAENVMKLVQASHRIAVMTTAGMATDKRKDHDESLRREFVRIGGIPIAPPDYTDHLN